MQLLYSHPRQYGAYYGVHYVDDAELTAMIEKALYT